MGLRDERCWVSDETIISLLPHAKTLETFGFRFESGERLEKSWADEVAGVAGAIYILETVRPGTVKYIVRLLKNLRIPYDEVIRLRLDEPDVVKDLYERIEYTIQCTNFSREAMSDMAGHLEAGLPSTIIVENTGIFFPIPSIHDDDSSVRHSQWGQRDFYREIVFTLPAVAYLGKKAVDIIASVIEAKLKRLTADKKRQVKIFGPDGELLKTIDKD